MFILVKDGGGDGTGFLLGSSRESFGWWVIHRGTFQLRPFVDLFRGRSSFTLSGILLDPSPFRLGHRLLSKGPEGHFGSGRRSLFRMIPTVHGSSNPTGLPVLWGRWNRVTHRHKPGLGSCIRTRRVGMDGRGEGGV